MASYKVVSLVLHQGSGHENGHYVAIHCSHNAFWYANDGKYPQPLPHLSDQHQQQVAQIWLVLEQPEELAPFLHKKQRCQHKTLHLIFGNVTNFGHKVQDWAWTKVAMQYFNARATSLDIHPGRQWVDSLGLQPEGSLILLIRCTCEQQKPCNLRATQKFSPGSSTSWTTPMLLSSLEAIGRPSGSLGCHGDYEQVQLPNAGHQLAHDLAWVSTGLPPGLHSVGQCYPAHDGLGCTLETSVHSRALLPVILRKYKYNSFKDFHPLARRIPLPQRWATFSETNGCFSIIVGNSYEEGSTR